jgi:hypothetical protein
MGSESVFNLIALGYINKTYEYGKIFSTLFMEEHQKAGEITHVRVYMTHDKI